MFRKELRRSLIFGRNDLIQDAPISHVDLLLCRNTLMYFNAEAQSQILNRLHFALRSDGILFLGKAEMLLSHTSYFRPVELKQRFFEKIVTDGRDRRLVGQPEMGPDAAHEARVGRLRQAALMSSAAAQVVLDGEHRLVMCNHRAMNLFGLTLAGHRSVDPGPGGLLPAPRAAGDTSRRRPAIAGRCGSGTPSSSAAQENAWCSTSSSCRSPTRPGTPSA